MEKELAATGIAVDEKIVLQEVESAAVATPSNNTTGAW